MNYLDDVYPGISGGDLPEDFFDDVLKEHIAYEKRVIYLDPQEVVDETMKIEKLPEDVSPIALVDFEHDELIMGYKYPQKPRYVIYNDMKPAREVFSWMSSFINGDGREFSPGVMQPMIPNSRYEKFFELGEIDQVMIARGFRILNPTIAQKSSYPELCDEVIRDSSFYILGPNRYDKNNKRRRPLDHQQIDSFLGQLRDSAEIISYRRNKEYYEIVTEDRSKTKAVVEKMQNEGFCHVELDNKRKKRMSLTKYYTRKYFDSYNQSPVVIVGFDYNPYSPYSAEDLEKIEVLSEGVKYTRFWKGEVVDGYWKFAAKRYHSDVWYPDIFSEKRPYNRAVMSLDMIANSYSGVEQVMFRRKFNMNLLTVPLLVDPFIVRSQYYKCLKGGKSNRSPIHYKLTNSIDQNLSRSAVTFLPYMTLPCKYKATQEIDSKYVTNSMGFQFISNTVNVKVVDKIFILEGVKSIEVLPQEFGMFVKKRLTMYNQGNLSEEEYSFFLTQAQKYFVQKQFFVDGQIKKRTKGFKKVLIPRYKIFHDCGVQVEGSKQFEYVPYSILRYPCNRWGSLVTSFNVFTLEEFVSQFAKFRDLVKDPPWLFKIEDNCLGEVEFDEDAAKRFALMVNEGFGED